MMMLISNDGDDGTQSLQQLDVGVNSLAADNWGLCML